MNSSKKENLPKNRFSISGSLFHSVKNTKPITTIISLSAPDWVHLNNLLTYKIFHTSASAKVVIGKEGWLFLGNINQYFDEIDYYRNLKPFTIRELRSWQILLEQRRNWLRRRGIRYLFAVAPNKSTIYPEFMPDAVKKINPRIPAGSIDRPLEKAFHGEDPGPAPGPVRSKKSTPRLLPDRHPLERLGRLCRVPRNHQPVAAAFRFMRPRPRWMIFRSNERSSATGIWRSC